MAWVRLDDGFAEHPKIARLGPIGAWIQVQALCYCNRNLTDGFVPATVATTFVPREWQDEHHRTWTIALTCGYQGRDVTEVDWVTLMVTAGVWRQVPGGYEIHDYDQYQPSKSQVLAERARNAAKAQRHRNRVRTLVTTPGSDRGPVPEEGKKIPAPSVRANDLKLTSGARARARDLESDNPDTEPRRLGSVFAEMLTR